jgi:hypothetical protein
MVYVNSEKRAQTRACFSIMLKTVFRQNYYFTIFDKHQYIDLVKKICCKLLSSDERVQEAVIFFLNPWILFEDSSEIKSFHQIFLTKSIF